MEFKIENIQIYNVDNAKLASGFPMQGEVKNADKRSLKLALATPGSGHDCWLKGVLVIADITAPTYWWPQFQRYHFADIVSSQSAMHCITKFELVEQCNEYVTKESIDQTRQHIINYNAAPTQRNFNILMANCPQGLMKKAQITTNALQLKTIYAQRKNHKLEEWNVFCETIQDIFTEIDLAEVVDG